MKKIIFLISFGLVIFSFQNPLLAQTENEDLITWKESVKSCVKDGDKNGYWVDIALDESPSMYTDFDPDLKARKATDNLIEELSLKVKKYESLNKVVYFNLYTWSGVIHSPFSTGTPVTEGELDSLYPIKDRYNTGGGTKFAEPFYRFYINSRPDINLEPPIDFRNNPEKMNLTNSYSFDSPPKKLEVNSKNLELCHVAIFLTDGEDIYGGYREYAKKFLDQDHTFLISIQVGNEKKKEVSNKNYENLKIEFANGNNLGGINNRKNSLVQKLENIDEIFLLWDEIFEALDEGNVDPETEGGIEISNEEIVEICPEKLNINQNNNCSYAFELNPLATSYTISGVVKNEDGLPASLKDIILRIIPPNQNSGDEIPLLSDQTSTIKNVDFVITPKSTKFTIELNPQANNVKDWVGSWKIEFFVENGSEANNRRAFINNKIFSDSTAVLDGPSTVKPFQSVCYDLSFIGENNNSVSTSEEIDGNIIIEDANGKEISEENFDIEILDNQYCITFKDRLSNTIIYLIPKFNFIEVFKGEKFELPTKYEKLQVSIGNAPNLTELTGFVDLDFGDTGTNILFENKATYLITVEEEKAKLFFSCSSNWTGDENSKPEHTIKFIFEKFEASCGEEINLEKGNYEFFTSLSIEKIENDQGELIYEVEIKDITYETTTLGIAKFSVFTYYVPLISRLLWTLIILMTSLLLIFAVDFIFKKLSTGFKFPLNLKVIEFNLDKNIQTFEEFEANFDAYNQKGLPTEKLRNITINSIMFSVKQYNKPNEITISSESDLFFNNQNENNVVINLNQLVNALICTTNDDLVRGVYFIDVNNYEEINLINIFDQIISNLKNQSNAKQTKETIKDIEGNQEDITFDFDEKTSIEEIIDDTEEDRDWNF